MIHSDPCGKDRQTRTPAQTVAFTMAALAVLCASGAVQALGSGDLGCRPPPSNAPADAYQKHSRCMNRGQPQADRGKPSGPQYPTATAGEQNVGLARAYVQCVHRHERAKKTRAEARAICEGLKP